MRDVGDGGGYYFVSIFLAIIQTSQPVLLGLSCCNSYAIIFLNCPCFTELTFISIIVFFGHHPEIHDFCSLIFIPQLVLKTFHKVFTCRELPSVLFSCFRPQIIQKYTVVVLWIILSQ
ncbi:unnamed protein product, partial [Sphacelaria rigidula]